MILKKLIDENFKHNLFPRTRDMSGDRDNARATLEKITSTNNAEIHLPCTQDRTLLSPGQKAYRGVSSH